MGRERKGYLVEKNGTKYIRLQFTDGAGRKRDILRKVQDPKNWRSERNRILSEIERHGERQLDGHAMTFKALADYYEREYVRPPVYVEGHKVAGYRSYRSVLGYMKALRAHFGNRRLQALTFADVRAFKFARMNSPTSTGRRRKIASVNRELALLRRILNVACREGWILKNPFNGGEPLISMADEKRRERVLTLEEETRLLKACEHPKRRHLRPLLVCLLDTGARKSEMLKLRWRSVCLATRVIEIEGMNTKTLKPRRVAITERMHRELCVLWEGSARETDALVFGITTNVRKSFASACEEAGIEHGGPDGLTLHSLRHTAATRLVKGQMPLQMVGRILGHSQPQTTYRYLSANAETAAQAAAILEAFQTQQNPVAAQPDGMGIAPEETWDGVVEMSDAVN
jgi:integrase